MKLLVVTDHRYFAGATLRSSACPESSSAGDLAGDLADGLADGLAGDLADDPAGGIFDTYCFDRAFFDDYRAVFDQVCVAARLRHEPIPEGAARSDGDGVHFVGFSDVQGARWALSPPRRTMATLRQAVSWADAVCVRIPSISGIHAFRWAHAQAKPTMFELIGDPWHAVRGPGHGLAERGFGVLLAAATRWITRRANVGSYVSRAHLQKRYPARPGALTESISSIRLRADDILAPRRFTAGAEHTAEAPEQDQPAFDVDVFELVLVASLVPVKAHEVLIRALRHAMDQSGVAMRLHLVGGGPLQGSLEALARDLGVAEQVVFHGHVADRATLCRVLDRAHLFVMTSVSEGMPRAMIEAMARGLPCVGTRVGGIAELLGPDELVPVGDSHALGTLIAELARDAGRLDAMAEHSHATAETFVDTALSARRQRLLRALAAAT